MGAPHTTVYNVVDILNEYNKLKSEKGVKVSANRILDNTGCTSQTQISKILRIYDSIKCGINVTPDKHYSEKLIKMVRLYNMCSAAPKILNGWRYMELLEDKDSICVAAHKLADTTMGYSSYTQYINIYKVFSYKRDGKLHDGVINKQLHDVADAYFDIVGKSDKIKKSINHKSNNKNVTATPVTSLNNDDTTARIPAICNSSLPAELIELLKIENELKQLKEKEAELLIKKDALITALNAQVNN